MNLMKKIMLTALSVLSPITQAGFVSDKMKSLDYVVTTKEWVKIAPIVAALKLENSYRAYETHEDSPLPSLKIKTDIILSAPVIKGLMTFFTAKENSTKTSLIHARDSFVKAVLAIALLKSAQHLKNVNFKEASKKETLQHLAVSGIRALAAFSYICGQTDTGFGDVYGALKKHGIRGLLTDKNLSVENMLRQTANILLPLLKHSNVKTFVQTQCQPKEIERAAIAEKRSLTIERVTHVLMVERSSSPEDTIESTICSTLNSNTQGLSYTVQDLNDLETMSTRKLKHILDQYKNNLTIQYHVD